MKEKHDFKYYLDKYHLTKDFQLFDKQLKKYVRLSFQIVKILLVGDGYENCKTLRDYRFAFIALRNPLNETEERLVKKYFGKKR